MTFDTTPVPVPVGACRCPGAPHGDGDVVYLAPLLSMAGGMAARSAIGTGFADEIAAQEQLAGIWLRHGIVGWTFTDDDGDVIPVSPDDAARLLPWGKGGRAVADKADDLYAQDALAPFIEAVRRLKPSPRGQTPKTATPPKPPTSAAPTSTRTRRKRSSR